MDLQGRQQRSRLPPSRGRCAVGARLLACQRGPGAAAGPGLERPLACQRPSALLRGPSSTRRQGGGSSATASLPPTPCHARTHRVATRACGVCRASCVRCVPGADGSVVRAGCAGCAACARGACSARCVGARTCWVRVSSASQPKLCISSVALTHPPPFALPPRPMPPRSARRTARSGPAHGRAVGARGGRYRAPASPLLGVPQPPAQHPWAQPIQAPGPMSTADNGAGAATMGAAGAGAGAEEQEQNT
jgi:hypothetical protein